MIFVSDHSTIRSTSCFHHGSFASAQREPMQSSTDPSTKIRFANRSCQFQIVQIHDSSQPTRLFPALNLVLNYAHRLENFLKNLDFRRQDLRSWRCSNTHTSTERALQSCQEIQTERRSALSYSFRRASRTHKARV